MQPRYAEIVSLDSRRRRREEPEPEPEAGTAPPARRVLTGVGLLLGLGLTVMGLSALPTTPSSRDTVARMSPEQRKGFVEREEAAMASGCQSKDLPAPVLAHCMEQARFLSLFPECVGDCWTSVGRFLPARARGQ